MAHGCRTSRSTQLTPAFLVTCLTMIQLINVSKVYGTGAAGLSDINLHIDRGEFVFFVGPSGSGKTTLLRLLIRDLLPSDGSIVIGDWDIVKLPNSKVPHLRKRIGVVFQDLKLLTDRTIFENIILPLEMANMDHAEAEQRVLQIMEQVGISDHKDKFPIQLSGGELQRAAIARALVFSPDILLADEPTGNLDVATSWEIVKLLQDINAAGTTILMATHNTDIVNSLLKRVVTLEKGKLIADEKKDGSHSRHAKAHHEVDAKDEKDEVKKGHEKGEEKVE
jgi:cell division transport system ATP-binding protein